MNFFDHKDLGNHLLQLRPKVVKHTVYYEYLCYSVHEGHYLRLLLCLESVSFNSVKVGKEHSTLYSKTKEQNTIS